MKTIYTTLFTLLFSITVLQAQTSVPPTDDMTTFEDGCAAGDPGEDKLWLANFSGAGCYDNILMKFDLTAYAGETVSNVKLKIYHFSHNPANAPVPTKIYAITEAWEEDTWNHLDNVAHGTTIYATPTITSTLGWEEIDITDLVNDWISGAIANEGLVIIPDSGSKLAAFRSKEFSDESLHPYLEFDITTGIEDNSIANFSFFPNPATDSINLIFDNQVTQDITISIVTVNGQKIQDIYTKETALGQFSTNFSVENIPTGIYFIAIKTANQSTLKKFIVK